MILAPERLAPRRRPEAAPTQLVTLSGSTRPIEPATEGTAPCPRGHALLLKALV
jgi:hypothetical protein